MKRITIAAMLLLSLLTVKSFAQDAAPIPATYTLQAKEDYAKYAPDFVKTVDWLQKASWNQDISVRKPANAFVMKWVIGAPDMTISIDEATAKLGEKNSELLLIYVGNYAKYAIENKGYTDKYAPVVAGLRAAIAKYQAETAKVKDPFIEKLADTDKDGKLEDWAKSNIK